MSASATWRRRLLAAATGTTALLMVGGIAYATWSATGAGATTATAGTSSALTVSGTVVGALAPGSSADLKVTVTNPSVRPVTVRTVVLNGSVGASAPCSTPGVTVTLPGTVSLTVPAGSSADLTLANAVAMSTASSSNCQGATFTIPLTATASTS